MRRQDGRGKLSKNDRSGSDVCRKQRTGWNGKQFRVKIHGLAFQTCHVKPSVVSPPPHAHAFLFFVQEMIESMRSASSKQYITFCATALSAVCF